MKKNGTNDMNPRNILPEVNEKGPIYSIPMSCAMKAEPHINEHETAQTREINFLFMMFIIVNYIKQQA